MTRVTIFGVAALCASLVLGVPREANNHRHHHPVRPARRAFRSELSTVTDVVTVTVPNAIVVVDQYKNIVRTDFYGTPVPTSVAVSSDSDAASIPTPPAVETPTPSHTEASTETPKETAAPATSIPVSIPSSHSSPPPAPANDAANAVIASVDTPTTAETSAASASTAPSNAGVANKAADTDDSGMSSGSIAGGGGFGIDYELIGSNGCKSQSQLNNEFGFLSSQGFSKIRFYDIGCDLRVATAAAAAAGMSVTLGLNTIGNVAGDLATLIGMIKGNWGPIDTVVIGNEVVNQGGSAAASVAAVNLGRGILQNAGFKKSVVAVDTYMAHQNNPQICAASDHCAVNAHAFFDANTVASNAGSFVQTAISKIQNNGKAIIVTESGWPYSGDANGAAVPSPANQQAAISSLKQAFGGNPGGLFLFQAYDATYKSPGAFGVEPFFGIYGH